MMFFKILKRFESEEQYQQLKSLTFKTFLLNIVLSLIFYYFSLFKKVIDLDVNTLIFFLSVLFWGLLLSFVFNKLFKEIIIEIYVKHKLALNKLSISNQQDKKISKADEIENEMHLKISCERTVRNFVIFIEENFYSFSLLVYVISFYLLYW